MQFFTKDSIRNHFKVFVRLINIIKMGNDFQKCLKRDKAHFIKSNRLTIKKDEG